ncbi:MAG: GAF domain-containing protein [Candidatus Latescibacteria bacterium]|nr:GAF domain-containing protein [Candidatus Latescibacterota bacterium]
MNARTSPSPPDQQRENVKLEVCQQIRTEIRKMHSTLDLGPLLWVICEGLIRLGLRFDHFGINLIEVQTSPPSGVFHFRTPAGGWGQYQYHSLAGSPLLAIWEERQVVYRRDLQAEDPYGERQKLDNPSLRCIVDVPFSHGTLALSSALPDAFAPGDLELLQEMAALCSEGFGRLDELRVLERRAQEAEVLSAAIAVVAGAGGLEEVFQVVVREAARLTSAERVMLFLYDETEKALVLRAQVGMRWEVYQQIRLLPGEDVSGRVFLSGAAVLYDHNLSTGDQTLRPENQALLAESAQSRSGTGAVVPLKFGDRVVGTLSVQSEKHHCTERDLVLLERLAAQASLAIERAQRARELALNLALQRMSNEILHMKKEEDWTRVRIAFREELGRLVDFCRCSIQLVDRVRGCFVSYGAMQKLDPSGKPGLRLFELRAGLRQVVESGSPLYRRTRAEIESWGEVEIDPQVNSVVDVPFLGGTLAMNSLREHAFSEQDIQVLEHFAQVMSEAYLRLRQLQRQEAVRRVREAVWQMQKSEDLLQVLTVTREQLIEVGIVFDDVGINAVDTSTQPWGVHYYYFFPDRENQPGWVVWSSATDPAAQQIFQFWRAGQPVYRPHMQREDMLREGWNPENLTHPVAAVLDLPFSEGTLALNSRYPKAFSPEDIAFLQEVAGTFSEGFRRLEDLKNLEQRAREAEALAAAISAVYSYADLGQRLQEIVHQVKELAGAQRCMLLLYDEAAGALVPRAREGYGEEVLQMKIGPGEGLSGQVYATGQVYANQALPDPQLRPLSSQNLSLLEQAIQGRSMGPSAGIPLKLRGQVIGTVVAGQVGRTLGERDLVLLERLAAQASLAIERSQHARELALNLALQRVRNQILEMQEVADWEVVLRSLHRELHGLVDFWFCSIQFIDRQAGQFTYYTTYFSPEDWHLQGQEQLALTLSLKQVVETGTYLYRRTRAEVERFQDEVGPEVNCIVDVPFLGGTVAMNSTRENAFSDQDLQTLERFAQVMSEAYQRLKDLRDLAQAQRQLQQAQKMQAVGQLSAGIAHNFNNLLQAILGNLNLAAMKSPAQLQPLLDDAEEAALRGAELIRQLMLFARREKQHLQLQPVDLGTLVQRTLSICRKTFDRRLYLPVELPQDLPLVQADASQLEQVLLNLYLNARDTLAEVERAAPCIRTTLRLAEWSAVPGPAARSHVVIEVADNGAGMDPQTLERIFEPFFTTKEVGSGTGLGLATAYGILQQHQGRIECASQPGVGTTFSLYLPVLSVEPAGAGRAEEASALVGGSETLLIIDDEELVRRSAAQLFVGLGYRVLEAQDGQGGLEICRQHQGRIDLVLLDLSMPGLPSREVLARLKALDPQVKVVLFTGYAPDKEHFQGAIDVVGKPFSIRQLAQAVRRALDP